MKVKNFKKKSNIRHESKFIILSIFFCSNIHCFQLLKRNNFLLFCLLCHCKLKIFKAI